MRKWIAISALFLIIPFLSGCMVVEKTKPAKETKVIVVPAQKADKKEKHKHKKDDKVVMCYKGKTKLVKKKQIDKFLKKGARLGSCY